MFSSLKSLFDRYFGIGFADLAHTPSSTKESYQAFCSHRAAQGKASVCEKRRCSAKRTPERIPQSALLHRWLLHSAIPLSLERSKHADVFWLGSPQFSHQFKDYASPLPPTKLVLMFMTPYSAWEINQSSHPSHLYLKHLLLCCMWVNSCR